MPDTWFSWSTTESSNSAVDGTSVATGMSPGNVDNALRKIMAACRNSVASSLQTFLAGTAGLGVASGGTGLQTATGVLKGNGTSAMSVIAPSPANGKKFLRDDYSFAAPLEAIAVYITDESTTVTTGASKRTLFVPYNFTLTAAFIGVSTQSSSGVVTVDVNKNGTTIFSTNPSIDANEDTSATGTAAALSVTSLSQYDKLTFDVDAAGTGAKGLQVFLVGYQS